MVTVVVVVPPEVAAKLLPVDVEARVTVTAEVLVVGLLKASSSVVVKGLVAELLAAALIAVEVMTSLVAPVGVMVSVWVAGGREVPGAGMGGVPDLVSP